MTIEEIYLSNDPSEEVSSREYEIIYKINEIIQYLNKQDELSDILKEVYPDRIPQLKENIE